jgi:hypothetical protein
LKDLSVDSTLSLEELGSLIKENKYEEAEKKKARIYSILTIKNFNFAMTINPAFSRVIKTWFVGIVTYHICKKFFPEKKLVEPIFLESPITNSIEPIPRGGNFLKRTFERLLEDRAFKFAMAAATTYFGYDMFKGEIIALLSSEDLIKESLKENGKVNPEICKIVEELDLVGLKQNVRELLIQENLTQDQKITLLKIKLDAVFNAEYPSKKLALLAILTAIMASIMVVGPYGIMIFLSAIYQLWKEGKISTAVYNQMKKEALQHLTN